MRCIECGKYPLCEFINNPQKEDCEKSQKRKLEQLVKIIDKLERRKNDNS